MSLLRPTPTQWLWIAVGGAAGFLPGVGVAIVLLTGTPVEEGAQRPSGPFVAMAVVATIMLAVLVGYGVGRLVEYEFKPTVMAVGAAVAAFLVGIVLPFTPVPIVLGLGALAVARRQWVRMAATMAILYAMGWVLLPPADVLLAAGGAGTPTPVVVSSFAVAGLVAYSAYRTVHPDRMSPSEPADT